MQNSGVLEPATDDQTAAGLFKKKFNEKSMKNASHYENRYGIHYIKYYRLYNLEN